MFTGSLSAKPPCFPRSQEVHHTGSFLSKIENLFYSYLPKGSQEGKMIGSIDVLLLELLEIEPKRIHQEKLDWVMSELIEKLKERVSEEVFLDLHWVIAPFLRYTQKRKERYGLGRKETEFSPEQIQSIQHVQKITDSFFKYAEYVKRKGNCDLSALFIEYGFKTVLASTLMNLHSSFLCIEKKLISQEGSLELSQELIREIEKVLLYQQEIGLFETRNIPTGLIQSLLMAAFPKEKVEVLIKESSDFKKSVEEFLEKEIFLGEEEKDHFIHHDLATLWIHLTEEGTWLIVLPFFSREYSCFETTLFSFDLFIPRKSPAQFSPGECRVQKGLRRSFDKELEHRKLAGEKFVLAETFFSPIPVVSGGADPLLKKGSNHKNLQEVLKKDPYSLSFFDLISIAQDVAMGIGMLSSSNFLYRNLEPLSIDLIEEKGRLRAKLDSFEHFTPLSRLNAEDSFLEVILDVKRLDFLSRQGYFSLDTDRFALIFFVAELFSFELGEEEFFSEQRAEEKALETLKTQIPSFYYEDVLSLKEDFGGFTRECSKEVFLYANSLREKDSIRVYAPILERFAFKMGLFSVLKDVFIKAADVNAFYRNQIEKELSETDGGSEGLKNLQKSAPNMPSPEDLYNALSEGERVLNYIIIN